MFKSTIQKIITIIIILMTALILAQSFYYARAYFLRKSNHEKVMDIISNDNHISKDSLSEEVNKIDDMISEGTFTDVDLGLLYEYAGQIYDQLGEEMAYYRYLGYALYYLEQSGEKDYTVNLYLKLACIHICNHEYDAGEELLENAWKIEQLEDISNPSIKGFAFRVLALLETEKKDYSNAIAYLNKSNESIENIDTSYSKQLNIADYNQITLANIYVNQGKLEECADILNQYKDTDLIEFKATPMDFEHLVIPYYQTKCIFAVAQNSDSDADIALKEIDEFVKFCRDNGYETNALDTLLELKENTNVNNEKIQKNLLENIHSLTTFIIKEQRSTHSAILNSQVNDSRRSMEVSRSITNKTKSRTSLIILSIIITCMIILFFIVIILNSSRDGLTFLFNRKSFDFEIDRIKRLMIPYAVIMVDIDDFKCINDKYGHPEGDKVLQKIGQLINNIVNSHGGVKGYRYGGEEFAIIISKESYPRSVEIAETLRHDMAATTWPFDSNLIITVSLGVAFGSGDDNVVKKADDNLYYSKQHGKNQIKID